MNKAQLHEPSLADVLARAVENILSSVHTAFPGTIEKYDYTTGKADIAPSVGRKFDDGSEVEMPVIPSVPVVWPRSSLGSISFPLSRGDGVLVVCSERSIDDWLSKGGKVIPSDGRRFDLCDAVAIPGLFSFNVSTKIVNNEDFQIIFKDNRILIKSNGDIEVGSSSLKKLVTEEFKNLFNNHVHNYQDIYYPSGSPSLPTICVTGKPASATGVGAVDVGANPAAPPTGLLGDELSDSHLTAKAKAQ